MAHQGKENNSPRGEQVDDRPNGPNVIQWDNDRIDHPSLTGRESRFVKFVANDNLEFFVREEYIITSLTLCRFLDSSPPTQYKVIKFDNFNSTELLDLCKGLKLAYIMIIEANR